MTEEKTTETSRLFLVNRHLRELTEKRTDKEFGLIRLKQHHESLLFTYFYKAYKESKGSYYGYESISKSQISFASHSLPGDILAFERDDLLDSLGNISLSKNINLQELFDNFIFTPSVFLFLPSNELFYSAPVIQEMFKGDVCIEGVCKGNKVLFIEPFTAYKLGLGFLTEKLVSDENVHSLLVGFIYEEK